MLIETKEGMIKPMQPIDQDNITVSVTVLKQMFSYLTSLGVDIDAFLHSINVEPHRVRAIDERISNDLYLYIQDSAVEYTNDPYFGLHMGEHAEAGSWSILGYMMANCKNLGEAFEKSKRYQRMIGNLITGDARFAFNRIKSVLSVPSYAPPMSRHCFEAALSSSVRMMRTLTGKNISPLEVSFTAPEPESRAEYERIFQCPVHFSQAYNSITIPISLVFIPIPAANPALLARFESYANDFIQSLGLKHNYAQKTTQIILGNLDDETLSIRKVAREMAVSVRKLQMELKEEGLVFTDLLTQIREELAKKYLVENYSVEEITYLLGYSEPSVFRKAFKKWSGQTPKEFRQIALTLVN